MKCWSSLTFTCHWLYKMHICICISAFFWTQQIRHPSETRHFSSYVSSERILLYRLLSQRRSSFQLHTLQYKHFSNEDNAGVQRYTPSLSERYATVWMVLIFMYFTTHKELVQDGTYKQEQYFRERCILLQSSSIMIVTVVSWASYCTQIPTV